jgi:hypothetical protein
MFPLVLLQYIYQQMDGHWPRPLLYHPKISKKFVKISIELDKELPSMRLNTLGTSCGFLFRHNC